MASIVSQRKTEVFGITTPSVRTLLGKGIPRRLYPFGRQYRKRSPLVMGTYAIANYNYWLGTLWGEREFTAILDKLIPSVEAELSSVEELCQDYLNMINNIEIVKQILIVEDEEGITIWTIIEAEPFDDSQRKPIYQAQINILRQVDEGTPIDFRILNISEYKQRGNIIPSSAKIVWQR